MAYTPKDTFIGIHGLESRLKETGHYDLFIKLCKKPTATTDAMLPIVEKMIGRRVSRETLITVRKRLNVPSLLLRRPIECAIRKANLWGHFMEQLADESVSFRDLGAKLRNTGIAASDEWVKDERKRYFARLNRETSAK